MKRCLYCCRALASETSDFHAECCKKFFGQPAPPVLPKITAESLETLAATIIRGNRAVTGVQPKVSLEIADGDGALAPKRFTIVGLWGSSVYPTKKIKVIV